MRFQDKNVLVTGAGRGIGREIAVSFAREGASVAINAAHLSSAEEGAQAAREFGGRVIAIEADVSDEAQVNAMVDRVVAELGGIDVLINNAGVSQAPVMPTIEQDTADFERIMNTNYRSAYLCSKAVGRHMVSKKSGKIVNLTSIVALTGIPMRTSYAPSKAALLNLTKVLAVEWAPHGINVNSVSPGFVLTDFVQALIDQGKFNKDSILKRTPTGRMSAPADIAEAVLFLASDAAKNIAGVDISVDGGWMANGMYM